MTSQNVCVGFSGVVREYCSGQLYDRYVAGDDDDDDDNDDDDNNNMT